MHKEPNIVIAEDMQMMRRLLKSTLQKAGFHNITEVMNGEELLRKMDESHFDIVICDWDMPRMSGIDALRKIRSSDTHKDIPFVMVTAVSAAAQIQEAIQAGTNDYIVKPIKPEAFISKIKSILTKLDFPMPVLS